MSESLPAAALQALQQGRMIEAIKIVRTERNIGLKQAKDQVEQYLQQHPEVLRQSRVAQAQQQGNVQRVMWVLGLLFLVGFWVFQTQG